MRHLDIAATRSLLKTRDDLALDGMTARHLDNAVATEVLHRVRRGWYLPGRAHEELWPEARHLAAVVAVNDSARIPPVFAFTSAAAVHGFGLYRVRADRVHTIGAEASRHSDPGIFRHRGAVSGDDIVEVDGIRCTSVERTAFDLARLASPEVALVFIDTALGRIGGDFRRYDEHAADKWVGEMYARLEAAPGARGIRQARTLLQIADGRSQQPLEIVTKLQLRRLGFRQPRLQIPVRAPGRGSYWMDIALDEAEAFYECDGETKYTDEALRSGRTLEEVLIAEKAREDWVRGTTRRRVLRGGTAHSTTPTALSARLTSFGVTLPDRRERLFLPRKPLLYGQ